MPSKLALAAWTAVAGTITLPSAMQIPSPAPVPIATRAVATLKVPGSADFLVADGRGVWVTNEGLVGDYWAILGFNLIAFQGDTDSDVWELSNWTCTGAGC